MDAQATEPTEEGGGVGGGGLCHNEIQCMHE